MGCFVYHMLSYGLFSLSHAVLWAVFSITCCPIGSPVYHMTSYKLLLLRSFHTGVRPKGAGGTSAPPRKNISACRNENRATVGTGMKVLFGQKLEVCWNQHKFINCETSLELDISKCRYLMFNSRHPYKTQQRHPQPARQRSAPISATVHSIKCQMLRYYSCDDFVGRKIL